MLFTLSRRELVCMVGAIEILKSESTKAETSKVSLSTISESAYKQMMTFVKRPLRLGG